MKTLYARSVPSEPLVVNVQSLPPAVPRHDVPSVAIWRVVDRCVQVLGGQGVTGETLVARLFNEVRGFRIYDGPSEVHRWSIAQRIARGMA